MGSPAALSLSGKVERAVVWFEDCEKVSPLDETHGPDWPRYHAICATAGNYTSGSAVKTLPCRGHRPAIQNRAAARHVPLTVITMVPYKIYI